MAQWRKQRHTTEFPVKLINGSGQTSGQVTNAHEDGAKFRSASGPLFLNEDETVSLSFVMHKVQAKVAWVNKNETGLSFPTPLSSTQLSALRRIGGW